MKWLSPVYLMLVLFEFTIATMIDLSRIYGDRANDIIQWSKSVTIQYGDSNGEWIRDFLQQTNFPEGKVVESLELINTMITWETFAELIRKLDQTKGVNTLRVTDQSGEQPYSLMGQQFAGRPQPPLHQEIPAPFVLPTLLNMKEVTLDLPTWSVISTTNRPRNRPNVLSLFPDIELARIVIDRAQVKGRVSALLAVNYFPKPDFSMMEVSDSELRQLTFTRYSGIHYPRALNPHQMSLFKNVYKGLADKSRRDEIMPQLAFTLELTQRYQEHINSAFHAQMLVVTGKELPFLLQDGVDIPPDCRYIVFKGIVFDDESLLKVRIPDTVMSVTFENVHNSASQIVAFLRPIAQNLEHLRLCNIKLPSTFTEFEGSVDFSKLATFECDWDVLTTLFANEGKIIIHWDSIPRIQIIRVSPGNSGMTAPTYEQLAKKIPQLQTYQGFGDHYCISRPQLNADRRPQLNALVDQLIVWGKSAA